MASKTNKGKAPQTSSKQAETGTLDSTTASNVKKVQQALGDEAPSADIIVMYLRENRNNVNQVVTYILDNGSGWEGSGAKSSAKKKGASPPPEVPSTSLPEKPRQNEQPKRPSRAELARAEQEKRELRYVKAQDATTRALDNGFSTAPKPTISSAGGSTFSYLQAAKTQPAPPPAPPAPIEEEEAYEEEAYVPTPAVEVPKPDTPKVVTSPKQKDEPKVPSVQSSPKKTIDPPKSSVTDPAAVPITLELRLPHVVELAFDATIVFSMPPPPAPVPKETTPTATTTAATSLLRTQREEQSTLTDIVGVFAPHQQNTSSATAAAANPAPAAPPQNNLPSNDNLWTPQPFSKSMNSQPTGQPRGMSQTAGGAPPPRAWPNPPTNMNGYGNMGGYAYQGSQGGWGPSYPSNTVDNQRGYFPPPPGSQGHLGPQGTGGRFPSSGYGNPIPPPQYNRGGSVKGPGGVQGTFPYSVTGDSGDAHKRSEGDWNYVLQ